MNLLIIRHGIAEVRDVFRSTGKPDEERPLTGPGRDKMDRAAQGLRTIVPNLSLVATSPLTRAMETAQIVAEAYEMNVGATTDKLNPDALLPEFVEWLGKHGDEEVVAAVGHEPHLGTLVTWLLTGHEEPKLAFRKGGAAMLEFHAKPRKGGGVLLWFAGPKILRRLGKPIT